MQDAFLYLAEAESAKAVLPNAQPVRQHRCRNLKVTYQCHFQIYDPVNIDKSSLGNPYRQPIRRKYSCFPVCSKFFSRTFLGKSISDHICILAMDNSGLFRVQSILPIHLVRVDNPINL